MSLIATTIAQNPQQDVHLHPNGSGYGTRPGPAGAVAGAVEMLIVAGIAIGILIVLAVVTRELILWFWRVNEAIALLTKIEKNTRHPEEEKVREPTPPGQ